MSLGTLLQNVLAGHEIGLSDHPPGPEHAADHPAIPPVTNLIPTISAAAPSRSATSFLDHDTNPTHGNGNSHFNHANQIVNNHLNTIPQLRQSNNKLMPHFRHAAGPHTHRHRTIRTSFAENDLDSMKESINSGIAAARGAIEEKLKATIKEGEM
jgi:hypothetical protein